jgi:hypothetical protein
MQGLEEVTEDRRRAVGPGHDACQRTAIKKPACTHFAQVLFPLPPVHPTPSFSNYVLGPISGLHVYITISISPSMRVYVHIMVINVHGPQPSS